MPTVSPQLTVKIITDPATVNALRAVAKAERKVTKVMRENRALLRSILDAIVSAELPKRP